MNSPAEHTHASMLSITLTCALAGLMAGLLCTAVLASVVLLLITAG